MRYGGLRGGRTRGRRASVFVRCTVSTLMYFSMTSYSSGMVFGGFLASLEEHGHGLTSLTAARIIVSSVISGVLALSCTNLRQKS